MKLFILILNISILSSCNILKPDSSTYPFNNLRDINTFELSPEQLEQRNKIYPKH